MNDISLYGIRSAVRAFVPLVVLGIGLVTNANAAPGGIPGPPGNGGGGMSPPDFGDLIFLYRDDSGVPILDANQCQQPIAFESDTCSIDCNGQDPCLVPVNSDTCAVEVGSEGCTHEVEFGRINEARSPDTVFESQLEDVVVNLATADCATLDPAGRMVATRVDSDLSKLVSTIDSPLQNLAIFRQLILTGTLGAPLPQGASILNTAARGLGAASDKTGEVNVDLVVYLNQIMGLSDPATPTILDPKICIDVKEEVQGTVQLVEKCFLDFSVPPPDSVVQFEYDRGDNFSTTVPSLPLPAYIPKTAPEVGVFEYLTVLDPNFPTFTIQQGPILDAVFCVDPSGSPIDPVDGSCAAASGVVDPGFVGGNIAAFTQAADDTRAVIDYMHTNQVPVEYETPVACEASGVAAYDVAISDVSGLQVPKIIVDGSEGREFSVTVAHVGGSDPAAGTVTVTATPGAGGPIEGSPWSFDFSLDPGQSQSFTQFFAISLGERTTIEWEAIAFAPDDVNLSNNTVTATSSVKVTGGGGGGPGGGGGGGGPGGGGGGKGRQP